MTVSRRTTGRAVLAGGLAAVLVAAGLTIAGPAEAVVGRPDGFAAVAALGLSGTTGGAGGPTVTVDTTDELLDAIDTVGALTIQVSGTIGITSKQGVRPNKTIIGLGSTATISGSQPGAGASSACGRQRPRRQRRCFSEHGSHGRFAHGRGTCAQGASARFSNPTSVGGWPRSRP